jgi:GABA(A) receptor-associated protein
MDNVNKFKDEAMRIMKKYPDRRPILVEKDPRSKIANIDKKKYLVPMDLTVGQFMYVIRKRVKLKPEEALFLFTNDVIPPTSAMISDVYEQHKSEDLFLRIIYATESVFG